MYSHIASLGYIWTHKVVEMCLDFYKQRLESVEFVLTCPDMDQTCLDAN